jgi:hypothetical protein
MEKKILKIRITCAGETEQHIIEAGWYTYIVHVLPERKGLLSALNGDPHVSLVFEKVLGCKPKSVFEGGGTRQDARQFAMDYVSARLFPNRP